MSGHAAIGGLSEAMGMKVPESDLDLLAVALMTQLERIRSLDRLDIDDEPLSVCFYVRWDG